MALAFLTTTAFERDLKRVGKQGKDLDKLETVVNLLQEQQPLPARCRPHPLRGDWIGHWDCHIQPDWLLLYTCPDLVALETFPLERILACIPQRISRDAGVPAGVYHPSAGGTRR